jgi:energy-coupling factor transporter ATP-binding protein EcfA2
MTAGLDPVRAQAGHLAGLLRVGRFPLPLPDAPDADREARALADQLDDYVLPRLATVDAPLLAVVGGSTGAGKSTLVNSLVGRQVSASGVLRPTTRNPVLLHHPDDTGWFSGDGVLPGLRRLQPSLDPRSAPGADAVPGAPALLLVPEPSVPAGLALLDAPDVDSVVVSNRTLATQLLGAADLWLFVTSAARYADAVPWSLLAEAARREVATAVVLDRVPDDALLEVSRDLASLMAARGLGDSPLLVVREAVLLDGLLPAEEVQQVRAWLDALARNAAAREAVVRTTLAGALRDGAARARVVATAADAQSQAVLRLRDDAAAAYEQAESRVVRALDDGTLLRTEVLSRWRDLTGASDLPFEAWVGKVRRRFGVGRPSPVPDVRPVEQAIASGLRDVLVDACGRAAAQTAAAWRAAGADELLEPGLDRPSPAVATAATEQLAQWRDGVLELVRVEGEGKKGRARGVAAGINGIGVVLIVATFAATGGLTGAELGIAAAAALASQKALESVFGSRTVRRLTDEVRRDLVERVAQLLRSERGRYDERLAALEVQPDLGTQLRAAADGVDAERHRVAP